MARGLGDYPASEVWWTNGFNTAGVMTRAETDELIGEVEGG